MYLCLHVRTCHVRMFGCVHNPHFIHFDLYVAICNFMLLPNSWIFLNFHYRTFLDLIHRKHFPFKHFTMFFPFLYYLLFFLFFTLHFIFAFSVLYKIIHNLFLLVSISSIDNPRKIMRFFERFFHFLFMEITSLQQFNFP